MKTVEQELLKECYSLFNRLHFTCRNMHHKKHEYHSHDEPCPVEAETEAMHELLHVYLKSLDGKKTNRKSGS